MRATSTAKPGQAKNCSSVQLDSTRHSMPLLSLNRVPFSESAGNVTSSRLCRRVSSRTLRAHSEYFGASSLIHILASIPAVELRQGLPAVQALVLSLVRPEIRRFPAVLAITKLRGVALTQSIHRTPLSGHVPRI